MNEVGTRRPGGRTARTRLAVLGAARAEVLSHGYGDLCIERVAQRAGVHKTTVYRRWQDRTGLVADLIGTMARSTVPVADTGSVDRDLRIFARDLRSLLQGDNGRLVAAMLAAAQLDETLARRIGAVLDDRYVRTTVIVERAVRRGELPEGTDPHAVIRQVAAPLYYDRMVLGAASTLRDADRAAAAAVAAARAGVLDGPGPGITTGTAAPVAAPRRRA